MIDFARAAAAVASRPGKLEKVALIAAYLQPLGDDDLEAAARFFTGRPFAARDQRTLALGGSTIVKALQDVWGVDGAALGAAYRETGDLGSAAGLALARRAPAGDLTQLLLPDISDQPNLFDAPETAEQPTPSTLQRRFDAIAAASGKNAARQREDLCRRILRACADPLEVTYVIKIMTGDLRIGLREGLVVDAIAQAFTADAALVRRAVMATGSVGDVALAAKYETLHTVRPVYGIPIGFMLASPIPYGDSYKDLAQASWIAEDKFDGIRAQAHVHNGDVRLFSRTLNDVTHSYPEIAQALSQLGSNAILDGEIVAKRDGRVLPFRSLQARLQRKAITDELLKDVPIAYMIFDLLAADDGFLIDEPLHARRARLAELFDRKAQDIARIEISSFEPVPEDASAADINRLFQAARDRGNEGMMLKRTDALYTPGRRGKWWLKLKRELSTLDVVVVAVEWGHGKRAKVLSDYTFAVRKSASATAIREDLATIGKAYSGLTNKEIAELTDWFLAHRTGEANGYAMGVEPRVVLEVAFDIIQKSDLHESGYALRFPRIVRIRDDKPAGEIDTLDRVEEIYREMVSSGF